MNFVNDTMEQIICLIEGCEALDCIVKCDRIAGSFHAERLSATISRTNPLPERH